jgi:hypothetical protein
MITAPEDIKRPLTEFVLPWFAKGELLAAITYRLTEWSSLLHLVPLLLVWAVLSWLIHREVKGAHPGSAGAA